MKIAVLGWGSLVHHSSGNSSLGQVPLEVRGHWKHDGPVIPIEYARVSSGARLTLVIDAAHGVPNTAFSVESGCSSLDEAAENLRQREGKTRRSWIGKLARGQSNVPAEWESIAAWLNGTAWDGVVWTNIPSNFVEERKIEFSISGAVDYLEALPPTEAERSFTYIIETPDEISTGVRENARWPWQVAVHEAGHYIAACVCGRDVIRLSRVAVDDRAPREPTIGVRYNDINQPDPVLIACDLAGAWAQVKVLPKSVASWKLSRFETGVLLPAADHNLYSWTGWNEDLTPVYSTMAIPPALVQPAGMPTNADIHQLDKQVGDFFMLHDVRDAVDLVAKRLLALPVIAGPELAQLKNEVMAVVDIAAARAVLLNGF